MVDVHGFCDSRFEKVRHLLKGFIDSGEEVGASISVNLDGKEVVNLWGGYTNPDRSKPWVQDTIVGVASSSKMFSSLAVLMLIDTGAVSPYDKVSKYWPEFGVNGKENVEIRHLLSHTSGVAGFDEKITMDEVADSVTSSAKLAVQAPWWEPGTASAYHAWTFGHPLGEIVRRVTGMRLKDFIAQKIAAPLGADFQLGVVEKDWPRLAESVTLPSQRPPANWKPGPLFMKVITNPMIDPQMTKRTAWREGEIGASNGYSNAHAMTTILSTITLADDEQADGIKQLISRKTRSLIFEEQSNGPDLAVGETIRFGIGYAIKGNGDWVSDFIPDGEIAYWGGSGGSLGIMDVGRKLTISYAMNKRSPMLIGNMASKAYVRAIYEALGVTV
ncbi:beta-lactamase [Xylariaceae sp. FL1019]|nr:beta-lactamase [Xylariaceae sp. FL1019]